MKLDERGRTKIFYGDMREQMPELTRQAKRPLCTEDLMRKRIEAYTKRDENKEGKELWNNWSDNYFDLADAFIYLPNGDLIIDYQSTTLRELTTKTTLTKEGTIKLTPEKTKRIEREKFSAKELEKMVLNKPLTEKQAQEHPIWNALTRGNKQLLTSYIGLALQEGIGEGKGMTIRLPQERKNYTELRPICMTGMLYGSIISADQDFKHPITLIGLPHLAVTYQETTH
jgi:hypothetical protein